MVEKKKLKGEISASALVKSLKKYACAHVGDNRYQLFHYDENLSVLAQYYSVKLNQHYKTTNEIKNIFNE